jgi:hypothetical protein
LLHSAEGRVLSGVHAGLGIAVLVSNGLAGAWGAVAWLNGRASVTFWPLLRVAQACVVAQVVLGLLLVASGEHAPDGLHIVYGISPLVVTLVTEGLRVAVAQKELEGVDDIEALDRREQVSLARRVAHGEMGVMTVGLLLILTLALRAFQTGG